MSSLANPKTSFADFELPLELNSRAAIENIFSTSENNHLVGQPLTIKIDQKTSTAIRSCIIINLDYFLFKIFKKFNYFFLFST